MRADIARIIRAGFGFNGKTYLGSTDRMGMVFYKRFLNGALKIVAKKPFTNINPVFDFWHTYGEWFLF